MPLNIDPKKRVEVILLTIADNLKTAAEAIRAGDEPKMNNWIKCAMECLDPLKDAVELLHPEKRQITDRLKDSTEN